MFSAKYHSVAFGKSRVDIYCGVCGKKRATTINNIKDNRHCDSCRRKIRFRDMNRGDTGVCLMCGADITPKQTIRGKNRVTKISSTHMNYCSEKCRLKTLGPDQLSMVDMSILTILGDCGCKTSKRLRHHPDYTKKDEVFLMCPSCHRTEHMYINRCVKQGLAEFFKKN
jgi:hypothetical protein